MPGTFVTFGNATQPFDRLMKAIEGAREVLPAPVTVQHGRTPCGASWATAVSFLSPAEYERHMRQADVVVMHAGAGSVLNAIDAGKVPVAMARLARNGEIVDDHQIEFAAALEAAGRVLVIRNADDLRLAIPTALRRQAELAAKPVQSELVALVADALRRVAGEAGA